MPRALFFSFPLDFEFQDPCSENFGVATVGPSAVADTFYFAPAAREDLPTLWAYSSRLPTDYRGQLAPQTLADLQASVAGGAGVRTMMGGGGPPPPADNGGGGDGDGSSAGSEIMALIGAGFLYAAVDRVLNKDQHDNAQALFLGGIGAAFVYYGRRG